MCTKVQKWGNSLAIRIPKAFAQEAHLTKESLVEVTVVDGRIVIERAPTSSWSLDQLLEGVTDDNIHHEIDTGGPVGNETW